MKILIKNSSMVFQKTNIIEKSVTKTFTQGDVGPSGDVDINLDTPASPNLPLEITVKGDADVVASNIWSIRLNGIQVQLGEPGIPSGNIYTNGDTVIVNRKEVINKVGIHRGSISAAGSITVTVKYISNPSYEPSQTIVQNVLINSEHTEEIITVSNSVAAPAWINLKMRDTNGNTSLSVDASLLDSSDNVISTVTMMRSNETWITLYSGSTNVSKVKIQRRDGSSANTTFAVTIVVP